MFYLYLISILPLLNLRVHMYVQWESLNHHQSGRSPQRLEMQNPPPKGCLKPKENLWDGSLPPMNFYW